MRRLGTEGYSVLYHFCVCFCLFVPIFDGSVVSFHSVLLFCVYKVDHVFFVNYLLCSGYHYGIYVKVISSGFEAEDVSVAGVRGDKKHKRSSVR